jgi:hypothetical protein
LPAKLCVTSSESLESVIFVGCDTGISICQSGKTAWR